MAGESRDIVDQAIAWHLRQGEMTAGDWRAFALWMDENPGHADAFNAIALDDSLLDMSFSQDVARPVAVLSERRPVFARRWVWGVTGGAMAAALAGFMALPAGLVGHADYEVTTQPGQRQTLALGDGTRIEMSGGTRLGLRRGEPRFAELKSGEAIFHVRHDAANPFTLHSGALEIRDLGTVFNVSRDGAKLGVQVAEGSVMYQPDAEAVVLKPGSALTAVEGGDQITIGKVDRMAVGGWRSGRLAFSGAPLSDVARAVQRQSGIRIAMALPLADKVFTGVVRLTGSAEQDVSHIAALIGADARRVEGGWTFEPTGSSAP